MVTDLERKQFEDELYFEYDSPKEQRLLSLLDSSSFEGKVRDSMERDIIRQDVNFNEYQTLLQELIQSQVDRIDSGMPYGATDINKKINKFIAKPSINA